MACSKDAGVFWCSREEAVCGLIFDKARSRLADIVDDGQAQAQ